MFFCHVIIMLDFMENVHLFIIILGAAEIPSKNSALYFILVQTPRGLYSVANT
jgi:hypothetical protein